MDIKDLIAKLEQLAPLDYAMDWDNCGVQVGKKEGKITKIGIALSPTLEIIEKAISNGFNLLLTHHPLIFKSLKKIDTSKPLGKSIELALKNNLVVYTLHTNFDSVSSGLNYTIAKDLGLDNIQLLSTTKTIDKFKLVTYVPEEYTLNVLNAISEKGAGNIDKFTHKSYITSGISTFYDSTSSTSQDFPSKDGEDKLEITVDGNNLKNVLDTLKNVHPY
ncbi:MAG: Nif3-like dinuclear metal center hexameric protein, partial [Candidatus Sericytochromatia bacterium]